MKFHRKKTVHLANNLIEKVVKMFDDGLWKVIRSDRLRKLIFICLESEKKRRSVYGFLKISFKKLQ